jgi:hypothetical protein
VTNSEPPADAHPVEVELSRKLLLTSHLNAPERAVLGDRVRFSVLLRLVEQSLSERAYFPPNLHPGMDYDGVVIEKRGDEYWTHERHESGLFQYGPVISQNMQKLSTALRFKLARGSIDGVIIDFER